MQQALGSSTEQLGLRTRPLKFLWLEITGKCNLECEHCYADSGPSQSLHGLMRPEDWLSVLREAAALGCRSCQFIGGEPTLHPHFRDFATYARQLGMAVEVYTNATRLTPDLIAFFAAHQIEIATSFYSDEPEAHERVTGRKGSWARTVDGVSRVIAAGLPLRVGLVETRYNPGHYPSAKRFLEGLGVERISFDRERHVGRGAGSACADPMTQLCGQCSKGRLCVTSDAEAYPCVFSRFVKLGDPRDGLAKIVASSQLALFQTELDRRSTARRGQSERAAEPCDPTGRCGPNQECGPKLDPCFPDRVHRPTPDAPGPLCSPQEIEEICSPQEPERICSPHETCSPGKT